MTEYLIYLMMLMLVSSSGSDWGIGEHQNIPPKSGVVVFEPDYQDVVIGPVRDRVGPNRLVSDDDNHRPQNEAYIIVNPSDPNHILGGCNDYRGGDASAGYYVSFNGGRNWEDDLLPDLDDFDAAGNPSVCMNREGHAWFCGIHFNRNSDHGGIFVHHSEDGGRNWEGPTYVIVHHRDEFNPPFEDKPIINIDNTSGEYDGNLYVSWTRFGTGQIYFSRSTDSGENWTDPMRIYAGRGQGSFPVVMTNGSLCVIWIDYSDDRMIGRYSDDGGESFGDIFVISDAFRLPRYLNNRDVRVNSIPSVAVDHSDGEHRDRIYVAWADIRSDDPDILMVWSDDGEEWTDPIRLNDDEFQNGLDQFFPWLAVDPATGMLNAVWYDRRLDDDNILMDVFGVRWDGNGDLPENERITSESFNPRGGSFNGRFIGDEIGVAALAGRAHPAWSDMRNDNQDIYWSVFTGDIYFEPVDGEREHNFALEHITINGEPPEQFDEVAVFDADEHVVGALILEGEGPWEFTATGDWVESHNYGYMHWKVWDCSEGLELTAAILPLEGDQVLTDEGETTLELVAPLPDRQEIPLQARFNIFSTGLYPVNIDPWKVVMPIEDVTDLMSDEDGRFLTFGWNFTNMIPFNPFEGYMIKVTEDAMLAIEGIRLDPQNPVPISPCWNIIAYLPDYELDPWVAFDGIIDDISLVKDEDGRFLSPRWEFSNMLPLTPGEGYQLKCCAENQIELVYPEADERIAKKPVCSEPVHFTRSLDALSNMSILILDIYGANVEAGEIAALTPDGDVCGVTVIEGSSPYGLAVWKHEENKRIFHHEEHKDKTNLRALRVFRGERSSFLREPLQFQYWNPETDREYNLKYTVVEGEPVFEPEGFAVLELAVESTDKPNTPMLSSVSPNPFNSISHVTVTIPERSWSLLSLYDLNGRLVINLHAGMLEAGAHRVPIDGVNLVSGLYLLRLSAMGQNANQRMVVIK